MLEIVITREGVPVDINVTSPFGFGLEQKAAEAVSKWRFRPAEKDGHPVAVHATGEVNFRLSDIPFDIKREKQRTDYNLTVREILKPAAG